MAAFALPLTLGYVYSVHVVVQVWWKCQCVSVSVEVSVFKGFSGRTLRNAFGKNRETSQFDPLEEGHKATPGKRRLPLKNIHTPGEFALLLAKR